MRVHVLVLLSVVVAMASCVSAPAPSTAPQLSFPELRRRMDPALTLPGVSFIGNAEPRVVVGILNPSDRQSVIDFAAQAGVPASSLDIRVSGPIRGMRNLRDLYRPGQGGVQIHNGSGECTLGAVAILKSTNQIGFITSSHCTDRFGIVDNTKFGQPDPGLFWSSLLGIESVDPPLSPNLQGCPAGAVCRLSDAVFADRGPVPATHFALGRIAAPGQMCLGHPPPPLPGPCQIEMNSPSDTLAIVGLGGTASIGARLGKIGRTSGWTVGSVSATCAHVKNEDRPGVVLLCQTIVDGFADRGDSGSPVFSLLQNNTVVLFGLLWGADGTSWVFSPIDAIQAELGALTLFP
jgi:hypothetical protein